MHRRSEATYDESGATLVIALIFVVAVGALIAALVGLTGNNLVTTATLQNQKALEYAADGAIETTIQAVRYSASSPCPLTLPTISSNNVVPAMEVECGGLIGPTSQITFFACPVGQSVASCEASPLVQAQVLFVNYEISDTNCQQHPLGLDASNQPCFRDVSGPSGTLGTQVAILQWTVLGSTS